MKQKSPLSFPGSRICRLALLASLCIGLPAAAPAEQAADIKTRRSEAAAEAARLLPQMSIEEKLLQLLAYRPNGVPRLGIPNLQAGEALHGAVSDGCTSFPQSIALSATFDPSLVREVAAAIAREARAVGMAQAYAPMLAVSRDARWGRVEESYGEDPVLVTRMGLAYIQGAQGTGDAMYGKDHIITTPKHFVADGEPWAGANGEGFETSERNLREIHMPPFEAAVRIARTGSIMPAHHAINGAPCHANHWLLGTVLRQQWGFDGFITSDMGDIPKLGTGGGYGGYRFVRDDYESAIASLNAGVDMELVGNHYMADIARAVKEGKVSMETVDRSAARVLTAKILLLGMGQPMRQADPQAGKSSAGSTMEEIGAYKGKDDIWARLIAEGRFSTPEGSRRPDWKQIVESPAHTALALRAAERSIVLLKNDRGLLPLNPAKHKRVLVVGPLATQVNLGGYSTGKPRAYTNVVDGLKAIPGIEVSHAAGCPMLPPQMWGSKAPKPEDPAALAKRSAKLLDEARKAAASCDVIVAVVGHTRAQLGENLDRDTLALPGRQLELVQAMHATGKPVTVVFNGGNIHSEEWIADKAPAILQMFYAGQETGTALARVLFGEVNPGGKMPLTTPRNVGQSPWYYNHPMLTGPINYYGSKSGPLYPFGHGLSYTKFDYRDAKVEGSITADGAATVSFTVVNTGDRAGDEVVQLYTRQDYTSVTRPIMELKGFERVHLAPGESRSVRFTLGFDEVKFWKDGQWVSEPGELKLMIGSSSGDIRLKQTTIIANGTARKP